MCQRRNFVWAFFDPSWFPKDFAPPGVLLGIQALGEVSHYTNLIFSFSNLTTNTLLTICLILGVNSSDGKLSVKEKLATESSSTPLLQFDWKAMDWCDSLFVPLRTDKLGWVPKPYVTHLLDGFSDSVWPQLYHSSPRRSLLQRWPQVPACSRSFPFIKQINFHHKGFLV